LNSEATYVSLAQYIFDVVRLDSIDHSILNWSRSQLGLRNNVSKQI
jgi:hypothetical protein